MAFTKLLFVSFLLYQLAKSEDNAEKEKYRLKGNLIPIKYDVELSVQDDFGTTGNFFGNADVRFTAIEDTSEIVIHSKNLTFTTSNVQILADTPGLPITIRSVAFNTTLETATITTENQLSFNSTYTLNVNNYEGVLDLDMSGFYRSSYKNASGQLEWIAVTQFQPTHARRAFPCFDEPLYKAKFDIVINHPLNYHAVSNAEVELIQTTEKLIKTTFKTTPTMSTYLVAFAITKFAGMTQTINNIKHTVWSSIETVRDSQYALSISPKLLKVMENYTKIPYSISGLSKLDQFSIPDFSAGAMENWGMVTYRETAVLWDPYECSSRNKQRVGTVVAHELSHMLFGNLVTTKWWSTTWLNEGFATFFEYVTLAQIEKEWELDLQFIIEEHQPLLITDSLEKAKPLTNPDVFTNSDVSGMFSSTTYSKGASIIRMMSLFLGEKTFYDGINLYLNSRKFNTSEPEDLFSKLQETVESNNQLPDNVSVIMKSWTENHGFPLISVKKLNNDLILTQMQFASNTTPPTQWYVPITYTTSTEKKFNNMKARQWLLPNVSDTVLANVWTSQTNWVILNVGVSAFIRVNYDDALWNGLQQALKKPDYDGITRINRAQIVNDAMNLARAGVISYQKAFNIISFLEKDTDYYPWYSAFSAFTYLRRRIDQQSRLGQLFNKHIQNMMLSLYNSVTFGSNRLKHVQNLKKSLILGWACKLGKSDCVSQAQQLFNNMKKDNTTIDPNLRGVVYCTALRFTDQKDNWEFLWKKLETNTLAAETAILISSLGCTNNKELLMRYLNESIKENGTIRRQDGQSVFNSVISGNPEGVTIGLKFLFDNFKKMSTSYGGMNALTSVINGIADRLTTMDQVVQLETFITNNRDKLKDAATAADAAIENAKKNLEWVSKNEKELLQYFENTVPDSNNGGVRVSSSFVLIFAIVVNVYIYCF